MAAKVLLVEDDPGLQSQLRGESGVDTALLEELNNTSARIPSSPRPLRAKMNFAKPWPSRLPVDLSAVRESSQSVSLWVRK